jgi:hypothetical protein
MNNDSISLSNDINDKIAISGSDGVNLDEFLKYKYKKIICDSDPCKFITNDEPWYIVIRKNETISDRMLFVIPGLSHSSYSKCVRDINSNYDEISNTYKYIVILRFSTLVKELLTEELDKLPHNLQFIQKVSVENYFCYELANVIYRLLNLLRLRYSPNIDILGKSFGCIISTILTRMDTKIERLYLSVPATINRLDMLIVDKNKEDTTPESKKTAIAHLKVFKMHMIKNDPIVDFESNYLIYNTQSMHYFNTEVQVYDTGKHELMPDFLRLLSKDLI